MNDYRTAYEHYKKACEMHGLEPINFHYFVLNLSQEQLSAYTKSAQKRGRNEFVTS